MCGGEYIGLVALASAPGSTLLAIAGHRTGHIQLIHLSPCPGPPNTPTPISKQRSSRRPHSQSASFIMAHTSGVTSLSVLPSGRLLATTSPQGTLIRIWDTHTGKLQNELRRGTDKAEIYGVAFTPDEKEVAVWSDKGTVHVFSLVGGSSRYVLSLVLWICLLMKHTLFAAINNQSFRR